MCTCILPQLQTHIHIHIYVHMHTTTITDPYTYTYICAHAYYHNYRPIYIYMCTCILPQLQTHIHIYVHMHTTTITDLLHIHIYVHMHTITITDPYTYICAHAYYHNYRPIYILCAHAYYHNYRPIYIYMCTCIKACSTYVQTTSTLPPPPRSLPCNRYIASTKASSLNNTIYFHYLPVFFTSCRSCLHLLPDFLVASVLPPSLLQ